MQYKVTATVEWTITLPDSINCPTTLAKQTLKSILPKNLSFQVCRTHAIKNTNCLEVLGVFTLEEVFAHLPELHKKKRVDFQVGGKAYSVKMSSDRYHLFNKSPNCISCGLKGVKFLLEQGIEQTPHFNLYGLENDQLILMTKDHTIPRSKGGKNQLDNYETMCSICNNLKADCEITYAQIKELRDLVIASDLSKKELAKLVEKTRSQMVTENRKIPNIAAPLANPQYETVQPFPC